MPGPGPGAMGCSRWPGGNTARALCTVPALGCTPCLPLCIECHPSFRRCPRNILFHMSLLRATLRCLGQRLVLVRGKEMSPRPLVGPGRAAALPAGTDRPVLGHPHLHPTNTQAAMRPCRLGRLLDPSTLTQAPLPRAALWPFCPREQPACSGKGARRPATLLERNKGCG